MLNIFVSLLWAARRVQELQDLGSFLHSGAAYVQGVNPYAYHSWLLPHPISIDALNLNPPISVYLFAPLTHVDTAILTPAFFIGTLVLFIASLAALTNAYPEKKDSLTLLTVYSMAGLWHVLGYLQIYAVLLIAVVAAWLLIRRGELLLAGILIGFVVAVKPNFIIWPMLLIASSQPRIALVAFASAATISAVPFFLDGPEIYRQWLSLTMSFSGYEWASNASVMSVAMRFGLPFLGQLMTGLVLVGVFYYQRRYRPNLHDSTTIAILAVLLLGPVSWAGYTLFLLPFLFSRPWNRNIWIAVLILNLPFWLIREATVGGAISNALLGSAYAWAVVLLMATVLLEGMPEEDKDNLRDRLLRARRTLMVILGREREDEPQPVGVTTSGTPRVRR